MFFSPLTAYSNTTIYEKPWDAGADAHVAGFSSFFWVQIFTHSLLRVNQEYFFDSHCEISWCFVGLTLNFCINVLLNPKKRGLRFLSATVMYAIWGHTLKKRHTHTHNTTTTKQKCLPPPVIFCGIRHDNLENPHSEPHWLLSAVQLLKGIPVILICFSLETERL